MIRAGASGWSTALTFLALAMAIGPSRFAIAAPDDEALIKQGLERRKRGDDEGALRLFEEAARLSRTGRAMAQIALAEQALGRWADAEVHMVEALSGWCGWCQRKDRWRRKSATAAGKGVAFAFWIAQPAYVVRIEDAELGPIKERRRLQHAGSGVFDPRPRVSLVLTPTMFEAGADECD
jgi:hypothetical protein